jgi:hypothetical protein
MKNLFFNAAKLQQAELGVVKQATVEVMVTLLLYELFDTAHASRFGS